jgi:hypothetical protein
MRIVRLLLAVVASFCISSSVYAANLVQNFSFETVGTAVVGGSSIPNVPSSWIQTGSDGCAFQALQSGEVPHYGGDFAIGSGGASLPTNGNRVLISDEGPNDVTCSIYQDVVIPAGTPASLTLAAGVVFDSTSAGDSTVSVDVTTPGGTPIANLYSRSSFQGNDALADRPSVNLDAYAGQTVRIIATVGVPSDSFDWTGLLLDNVRLDANTGAAASVPTMNEWGMIIFMVLAGLGAVYYMKRCRKIKS